MMLITILMTIMDDNNDINNGLDGNQKDNK